MPRSPDKVTGHNVTPETLRVTNRSAHDGLRSAIEREINQRFMFYHPPLLVPRKRPQWLRAVSTRLWNVLVHEPDLRPRSIKALGPQYFLRLPNMGSSTLRELAGSLGVTLADWRRDENGTIARAWARRQRRQEKEQAARWARHAALERQWYAERRLEDIEISAQSLACLIDCLEDMRPYLGSDAW